MTQQIETSKWEQPQEVSQLNVAFGGGIDRLLPSFDEIPEEFKRWSNPWCQWQAKWFFKGLQPCEIPDPKDGIDRNIAMRHLAAIQGSFEPQHEHKEAAVAWLASLWFVEPK